MATCRATRASSPQPATGIDRPEELPDVVDVLIVGTGPAGMVTAAQLAQFPDVTTRIIDRRGGRLEIGQADGIQARSVETFQAFGFADRITAEAYRITEMAFWKPDPADPSRIVRTARALDDEHGVSEFPHLLVNQARVLDYFAEWMLHSPTRMTPDYGWEFTSLEVTDGRIPGRRDPRRDGSPRGRDAHRAREVRRRRRRCPQQGARRHRLHARRRPGEPRLGRHGRAGRDRLPRHPHQMRDPVERRADPPHPARGRAPVPDVRRPRRGGRQARRRARDHDRPGDREGERDPEPLRARRAACRVEQRLRGRAPADLALR